MEIQGFMQKIQFSDKFISFLQMHEPVVHSVVRPSITNNCKDSVYFNTWLYQSLIYMKIDKGFKTAVSSRKKKKTKASLIAKLRNFYFQKLEEHFGIKDWTTSFKKYSILNSQFYTLWHIYVHTLLLTLSWNLWVRP